MTPICLDAAPKSVRKRIYCGTHDVLRKLIHEALNQIMFYNGPKIFSRTSAHKAEKRSSGLKITCTAFISSAHCPSISPDHNFLDYKFCQFQRTWSVTDVAKTWSPKTGVGRM